MLLLLAAGAAGARADGALSNQEVEALVTGNTLKGEHLRKGFEFALYAAPDGTLKEYRKGSVFAGEWHMDGEGRFCWSYNHKDKTWCRRMRDNGDGTYTKYRDSGREVRRFEVVEGEALGG